MRDVLKVSVKVALIAISLLIFTPAVRAGEPYTVITVFNHTNDPTIRGLDKMQYNFNRYSTIRYQHVDLRGNDVQQRAQIQAALARYPDAKHQVVYAGHGVTTGNGTDGLYTRQGFTRIAHDTMEKLGISGALICDDCGSGRLPGQFPDDQEGGILDSVAGSSEPNQLGWAPYFGERIQERVLNGFRGDANKDGVITNKEFADAMALGRADGEIKVVNPDEPLYFRNKEKYDEWQASKIATECIVVRPGQVEESFTGPSGENVSSSPASISGYEKRGDKVAREVLTPGDTRDFGFFTKYGLLQPNEESEINHQLRTIAQSTGIEEYVAAAVAIPPVDVPGKPPTKRIYILPTVEQAKEFVGNKTSYTVNGISLDVGSRHTAGKMDPTTRRYFDKECTPSTKPVPTTTPDDPEDGFGDEGGGGGGGGGDEGGGLSDLLGALMKLLGQGNQNQNPMGANSQQCAQYGVSPVCGSDGQTYTNQCYLQQFGVTQVSAGVCPAGATSTATPTPTPTPSPATNPIDVLDQLAQSGIPTSLLEVARNAVATILSAILGGGIIEETLIQ